LILTAVVGAAILAVAPTALAVPITVHEKVPVIDRIVTVSGKVAEIRETKIVEKVVHVPPADSDDDGYADSEDPCPSEAGPDGCAPEPVIVESSDPAAPEMPTYTDPAVSSAAPSVVQCESGGDYAADTGNGYYGGYQFDSSTWDAYGDPAYGEANEAPPAVQDAAAASVPYDAWPNC
jgi:hypothetical protein